MNSCCKRLKNATCESALYYYLWMELNGINKPGSLFSKVHYKRSVLCFFFIHPETCKLENESCLNKIQIEKADSMAPVKMF